MIFFDLSTSVMPCKCVWLCCHIWWGNERYARGLTKAWWQICNKKSRPHLLAAWICPHLSGSMFLSKKSYLSPYYPQIILPLAIAGSLGSFEKSPVICQVNGKLELLAGSKMVLEGRVQRFEHGQQLILCVCIIHLYQNPVVFLSLVARPGVPAWLGLFHRRGCWAQLQRGADLLMFSTWSPKRY